MSCRALSVADEADSTHQLGLADLAKYHAALTGRAATDDARVSEPVTRVGFRDLWNQPETFRGRRVLVEGRVQRIFRQGPVGTFPALAEVWIVSSAGDPFCLVFPQHNRKVAPAAEQSQSRVRAVCPADTAARANGSIHRYFSQDGQLRRWRRNPFGSIDRGRPTTRCRGRCRPPRRSWLGPRNLRWQSVDENARKLVAWSYPGVCNRWSTRNEAFPPAIPTNRDSANRTGGPFVPWVLIHRLNSSSRTGHIIIGNGRRDTSTALAG